MSARWSIDFALRDLEDIEPWGQPGLHTLSWFALSEGYFVLRFGHNEVFRYDASACESLGWPMPAAPPGFELAVDYPVCRLFRDLTQLIPNVVEAVPEDVVEIVATADDQAEWNQFVHNWNWEAAGDRDDALLWVDDRTLDSSYLKAGPDLTFWLFGGTVRVRSDLRSKCVDGTRIWTTELIEEEIRLSAFLDEVQRFGDQLLWEMNERVKRIEAGWRPKGVPLDPQSLRKQQESARALWAAALTWPRSDTDWDVVRAAMQRLPRSLAG